VGDQHRFGGPLRTYAHHPPRLFVLTATRWGCLAPHSGCSASPWSCADERWLRLNTPDRLDLQVWNGREWLADPWAEYRTLFHRSRHTALHLDEAQPLRRMAQKLAMPLAQHAIQRAIDALRSELPHETAVELRIKLLERRALWHRTQINAIQDRRDTQIANLVPGPLLAANRARIDRSAAAELDPHERSAPQLRERIEALQALTGDDRTRVVPCVRTWWVATG
jgi:hypothetical protein